MTHHISQGFQPLSLDFTAPSQLHSSVKHLGVVLLLAGAIGLAYGAVQLKNAFDAKTEQQTRINALNAKMQNLKDQALNSRNKKSEKPDAQEASKVRAAQQAATELQMPWADLLTALETVPTQDIAVLSIEPSAASRSVKLIAEAKHPTAMLRYLEALQKDKRLNQVMLTQHQVQMQSPGSPVRFQLQAYWGGGFAGAPELIPSNTVMSPAVDPQRGVSKSMMVNNNAQQLPLAEQEKLARELGNSSVAGSTNSPSTDVASRTPRN